METGGAVFLEGDFEKYASLLLMKDTVEGYFILYNAKHRVYRWETRIKCPLTGMIRSILGQIHRSSTENGS